MFLGKEFSEFLDKLDKGKARDTMKYIRDGYKVINEGIFYGTQNALMVGKAPGEVAAMISEEAEDLEKVDVYNLDWKRESIWIWVSPDDRVKEVKDHRGYIMDVYKYYSDCYDIVFERAMEDGWVRIIYRYDRNLYRGDMSVHGRDDERVIGVILEMFRYLMDMDNDFYIDIEEPKMSMHFSTYDGESKVGLLDYLGI